MIRKFAIATAAIVAATVGGYATADEAVSVDAAIRTTEYSQGNAEIVPVRDYGRRYRRNYNGNRRYNNYSPYRNGYRNYDFGYRSYRNYYYRGNNGYNRNRYYGNGYYRNYAPRGGVRVGPVGVWW